MSTCVRCVLTLVVQKTEIISIQADVTHVDENDDRYVVSVRFNGVMRGDSGAPHESFDEVWNLMKPRTGNPSWYCQALSKCVNKGRRKYRLYKR